LVDIQLPDGSIEVCHNPALACNGLVSSGAIAYVMPAAPDSKAVSKYTLYHIELVPETAEQPADVVCVHPAVANDVAAGLIDQLLRFQNQQREVTCGDCRFDFAAQAADGRQVYLEVKNASIADTVNCLPAERTKALKTAGPDAPLAAIFPYGNKPKAGLVSPRALKHAEGLARICKKAGPAAAYIIYMSQRPDVERFKISTLDSEYRAAVSAAAEAGVIIQAYSIRWIGRRAYLRKALPIDL
jgi:DNA-binding sugar fermentation-stimulating protein